MWKIKQMGKSDFFNATVNMQNLDVDNLFRLSVMQRIPKIKKMNILRIFLLLLLPAFAMGGQCIHGKNFSG